MLRRTRLAVCLLVVTIFIGGCSPEQLAKLRATPLPGTAEKRVRVPHFEPPANSMVVFNFRWSGDTDAQPYAAGFARALGDRLYCAPKCLTHQPTSAAIEEKLELAKLSRKDPIPDELAVKIGKTLGVRYVLTGDFKLTGDQAKITSHLIDVAKPSSKPRILRKSGPLADLPRCQVSLANDVGKALRLRTRFQPNFSNPKTLLVYGKSVLAEDYDTVESLRWQALEGDPNSSFPVIRLMAFYVYGPACGIDIIGHKKLNALMDDAARQYPDDSHITRLRAWLLVKEYHYKKAENLLCSLVERDPNMAIALDDLYYVALDRNHSELAIQQAEKLVALWPSSARAHMVRAKAYETAANDARYGRYFNKMSMSERHIWETNSESAYVEASNALSLDYDNYYAWTTILSKSRELGYDDYIERAFEQMVRINPKCEDAYIGCAYSFAPKWGGTYGKQEEILKKADREFGPDSIDALMIRESVMMLSLNQGEDKNEEALKMLDLADKKWKRTHLPRMKTRCYILFDMKRHEEILEIAKKGFAIDPSPDWRLILARAYQYRYQEKGDRQALDQAADLMKVYVEELPLATHGHNIYGWCLSHQGKPKEAREQFLTTLRLDPDNKTALEKIEYVGGR